MYIQRCPSCNGSRIRRGYRPTNFFFKLIFRYNLLCDGCNLEFRGFAFPRPAQRGSRQKKRSLSGSEPIG